MSNERSRLPPETQHELRFTARDPILDEALAGIEAKQYRDSENFPKNLFIYAMKSIILDTSDTFNGRSQNEADFYQYSRAVDDLSQRGMRRFKLLSYLHPLHDGGSEGPITGVGLRVGFDQFAAESILRPPLYGTMDRRASRHPDWPEQKERQEAFLRMARTKGYLPVRYEINQPDEDLGYALDRLKEVLDLGAWVSQLTVVSRSPDSARTRDKFLHQPLARSYTRIDEALSLKPLPEPINLIDATQKFRRSSSSSKPGPEAA